MDLPGDTAETSARDQDDVSDEATPRAQPATTVAQYSPALEGPAPTIGSYVFTPTMAAGSILSTTADSPSTQNAPAVANVYSFPFGSVIQSYSDTSPEQSEKFNIGYKLPHSVQIPSPATTVAEDRPGPSTVAPVQPPPAQIRSLSDPTTLPENFRVYFPEPVAAGFSPRPTYQQELWHQPSPTPSIPLELSPTPSPLASGYQALAHSTSPSPYSIMLDQMPAAEFSRTPAVLLSLAATSGSESAQTQRLFFESASTPAQIFCSDTSTGKTKLARYNLHTTCNK